MDEHVLQAALAGLLHDVGKIEQRARTDPWNPAPGIDREGQPVHATWTAYFAQQYLPDRFKAIGLQAAYHHQPGKSPAQDHWLSEVVELADKLSAGERADVPDKSQKPPQQLVTIFDRLSLSSETTRDHWHYLPLKPLTLADKVIFPAGALSKEDQGQAYQDLCEMLRAAARQDVIDDETYLENLLAALQRATWCVPSAYYHSISDVSLYDHSRMTAALAVCLTELKAGDVTELLEAVKHSFHFRKQEPATEVPALQKSVAVLVGGDISGVQNFIYTLSAKGAAKTLRGRSFYLQLLNEAVLRFVLRELGLPSTNVIYSGGGHFYLLAPPGVAQRLATIRQKIDRALVKHHGTALYLALESVEVPAGSLKLGAFPEVWDTIHLKLGRAKQRRYLDLGDDLYQQVFKPHAHGGNQEKTCSVCSEERDSVTPWDEEKGARICPLCRSMVTEIGQKLPGKTFVALGLLPPRNCDVGTVADALREFGLVFNLVEADDSPVVFAEKVQRAVVWAMDDVQHWPRVTDVPSACVTRYTVSLTPFVGDRAEADEINQRLEPQEVDELARARQPKTFNHLQAQAMGIPRLGVLRMDVDQLGDLFSYGFGEGQKSLATLARISTLSFQLSLFFEGWIKRLCEQLNAEQRRELIYAVYAGGDDVFLIGPWDQMPTLARTIASELSRYAGGNLDVHLSGGIAFVHGKYPVYQAADDAKEALAQAKHIDDAKNALSFLGRAWRWNEFKQVAEKQQRLLKIVGDPEKVAGGLNGSQAILQTLRQLAQDEADTAKRLKGRPVWGPWMWHGAYQLTRMAKQAERNDTLSKALLAIRDELSANNYGDIAQWGAAARWAQLWLRGTATD
jgi:CRISPR-associated protein Csm1